MSFLNNISINLGFRRKISKRRNLTKLAVCFFLISLFFINFLFIQNQPNYTSTNSLIYDKDENNESISPLLPKISSDPSETQDPFTKNFSAIWTYFNTYFKSNLASYDIPTYIREKTNVEGTVDNGVYSIDNLLLYYSLLDGDYDQTETLEAYIDLKSTPLWFEENKDNFEYGFVGTIDGNTGSITNDTRYLIDNVLPIYLLLEDGGN